MKAKGIIYGLGDRPKFRGMIRVAAGWVHVLDGGEKCLGFQPDSQPGFPREQWEPLTRPVSIPVAPGIHIEWLPRDTQIKGQTRMSIGGSE